MNTPVLFISREKLRSNYLELRDALTGFEIAFAIKSNSHPGILEILRDAGSSFEVASWREIELLLSLKIPPEKIVFSNPVKPRDAIRRACESGVRVMSFDSLDEVEKFADFRDCVIPVLRIQVPNEGSLWPLTGKFGAATKNWASIFKLMEKHDLKLRGVTFHPGSQCETITGWDVAMKYAYDVIKMGMKRGHDMQILNIGGGFPIDLGRPIPKSKKIAKVVLKHLQSWKEDGYSPTRMLAEPGRFISGSAGVLAASVIGLAKREEKWAFLDVGVFSGLMETIDGITYPLVSSSKEKNKKDKVILCGPSCDSVDKMFTAELPQVHDGDILLFYGAGAYSTVYGSSFNGFPPPEVVFVDDADLSPERIFKLLEN